MTYCQMIATEFRAISFRFSEGCVEEETNAFAAPTRRAATRAAATRCLFILEFTINDLD